MEIDNLTEKVERIIINSYNRELCSFRDYYFEQMYNPVACMMAAFNFIEHSSQKITKEIINELGISLDSQIALVPGIIKDAINYLKEEYHAAFERGPTRHERLNINTKVIPVSSIS